MAENTVPGAPQRRAMTAKEQFTPKGPMAVSLGERLRTSREGAGHSIRDMAEKLGVGLTAYRMYECGASVMRVDTLLVAAAYLEIDAAELLAIHPAAMNEAGEE